MTPETPVLPFTPRDRAPKSAEVFGPRGSITVSSAPARDADNPPDDRPTDETGMSSSVAHPGGAAGAVPAPGPAVASPAATTGPTPAPTIDGRWSVSPLVELQLADAALAIARQFYACRLLLDVSPAVARVPYELLPAAIQAVYREAAEVAIRRMDPYLHAGAVMNARRIAPQFEAALEAYHRTLTLPATRERAPLAAPVPVQPSLSPTPEPRS